MATAGDRRASYESGGAEEALRKRPFLTENNEELRNVSQETGRNNSTGVSYHGGNSASISSVTWISELEQMLKQKTFTRSEAQRVIALVHSRTIEEEESPSSLLSLEPLTTYSPLKKRKSGDESHNLYAVAVTSRVLEEENASPAELAKVYKVSTGQAPRQSNATCLSKTSVASPQHPTTMGNLPDELLSNIFIRILAKQLAQMRSVCKSWNTFLSRSSFIKSHLHRSIHDNDRVLLVFYDYEKSFSNFKPFGAFPFRSPHPELTNFIKLPVNLGLRNTNDIGVIGAVNGLICFSYGGSVIQIWNPSISAVLTLPPYSTPSGDNDSINTYLRFGFDPKTNDYKVVKLTALSGLPTCVIKWWLQIEIYSMRKGTWELITARFPSHITELIVNDYVCADGHDGHLHWLGYIHEKSDSERIVAFDLGSETFCEIPLPDSTVDDNNRSNELGVLSGKLCFTSRVNRGDVFEVWVMEEYGVAESWVKCHVISQFVDCACPFGFSSQNEFLLEDNGYLVVYDPVTNKQKVLKNYRPEEYSAHTIVEYVDSLVWITPAKHEMMDDAGQN